MEISGCGNHEKKKKGKQRESGSSLRVLWRRICSRVVNLLFYGACTRSKITSLSKWSQLQTRLFLLVSETFWKSEGWFKNLPTTKIQPEFPEPGKLFLWWLELDTVSPHCLKCIFINIQVFYSVTNKGYHRKWRESTGFGFRHTLASPLYWTITWKSKCIEKVCCQWYKMEKKCG